jgi:acetyl esterase/lipase
MPMTSTTHVYREIDGEPIHAEVYRADGGAPCPAILFIHGGGLIMGHRMMLPSHLETIHRRGYSIVSIDYRLAPETKLPQIVDDVAAAWSWLRREARSLGIDRDRIAVLGHSGGGYLALWAGFGLEPRPAAVVSIAGYGQLASAEFTTPSPFYSTLPAVDERVARDAIGTRAISGSGPGDSMQFYTGRGGFYLSCRQRGIWLREISGHDPRDADWFAAFEPLRHVTADYPTTLLLHGDADTDIDVAQAVAMQQALARHRVTHDFVRRTEWGHVFLYTPNDPTAASAFEQIAAFLDEHVRNR